MNRRSLPTSLATVLDDNLHWLGRWQCSIMFPDKVTETNPHGPDTLMRWLSSIDQRELLTQPIVHRLQELHDELHDQAYQLGVLSPRSRPPYEEYEAMLRNFDSFVGQLRRVERLIESANKAGGLAALNAGKSMEFILQEIAGIMTRMEAKGVQCVIAVASIDNYDEMLSSLGASGADFVSAEVTGRIGHNLRPFDDVFRLDQSFTVWFLQQTSLEDAVRAADRVRRKVSVLPVEFPDGDNQMVTISVSLVGVDYSAPPAELINLALDALRLSQGNGTDQVVTV